MKSNRKIKEYTVTVSCVILTYTHKDLQTSSLD